ncbi:MAG TPA: hypothetical protein VEG65_00775 [Candidatus Bathyarchaeia archaeon]|nr:hypothetical protein [Candidatus Bathyarchaeia archaeon]
MLSSNLSGYPTRPDLNVIRDYLKKGGEDPFTLAINEAVQDQVRAGVDIITDGQIRRLTSLIASKVTGILMDDSPRITNTISTPRTPSAASDFLTAARECGDTARVKAVLPGPFSFAESCVLDEKAPYRSKYDVDLLFDTASVLRYEIDALRDTHANLIQIVEPIEIVRDLELFQDLLATLFKRVKTPVCHLSGNVSKAFLKLLDAKVTVISFNVVDFTQNNAILEFKDLFEVHEKIACVGCVASSKVQAESTDALEKRVKPFVDAFGAERVWISPSTTLANVPRSVAFDKLRQLEAIKRRVEATA